MATQLDSTTRLLIGIASLAVVVVGLFIALPGKKKLIEPKVPAEISKVVQTHWDPGPNHPIVQPTDFYSESLLNEPTTNQNALFAKKQVGRSTVMPTLLLHDGDLLADYSFLTIRDIITNEQLFEAKMLARKYDVRLKEIRRERAAILEQAGVSIQDPEPALNRIRAKASILRAEAHKEILETICDEQQRVMIAEKSRRKQAAKKKAARRAVEASKDDQ